MFSKCVTYGETPDDIRRFDIENQKLKDEVSKHVDPADLDRRNRQDNVIKEIMAR